MIHFLCHRGRHVSATAARSYRRSFPDAAHGFRLNTGPVVEKANVGSGPYSRYGCNQALLRSVIIERMDTATGTLSPSGKRLSEPR